MADEPPKTLRLLRPRTDVKFALLQQVARGWELLQWIEWWRQSHVEDAVEMVASNESDLRTWSEATAKVLEGCFGCDPGAEHPARKWRRMFKDALGGEYLLNLDVMSDLEQYLDISNQLPDVDVVPVDSQSALREVVYIKCMKCGRESPADPAVSETPLDSATQQYFVVHRCHGCNCVNVAVLEYQLFESGPTRRRQVSLWPRMPSLFTKSVPEQLRSQNSTALGKLQDTLKFFPHEPEQSVKSAAEFLEAWLKAELHGSGYAELAKLIKAHQEKRGFRLPDTSALMHGIRKAANQRKHGTGATSSDRELAELSLESIDLLLDLKYRAETLKQRWNDLQCGGDSTPAS